MEKNFFDKTGKMALGSRLRLLSSRVTDDATNIYEMYGLDFAPKWFPVFFTLTEIGEKTITDIAHEIMHSQPSVTKIVQEMTIAGFVQEKKESPDKRRNVVKLSQKGIDISERLKVQCQDIDIAIETIIAEANYNLWEALAEWEFLLDQKSLLRRVQEQKKIRESRDVNIVEYKPAYQAAFKALNEEWISNYFEMEDADYAALDKPEEYILQKGGKIFVALYNNEPVGVCALIKMNDPDYDFELAKMAVSPKAHGKNIGWMLGSAVVKCARDLGAKKLYLESNTILKPAISLYQKLGFQKIVGRTTPYQRCNIQMELDFNKTTA